MNYISLHEAVTIETKGLSGNSVIAILFPPYASHTTQ